MQTAEIKANSSSFFFFCVSDLLRAMGGRDDVLITNESSSANKESFVKQTDGPRPRPFKYSTVSMDQLSVKLIGQKREDMQGLPLKAGRPPTTLLPLPSPKTLRPHWLGLKVVLAAVFGIVVVRNVVVAVGTGLSVVLSPKLSGQQTPMKLCVEWIKHFIFNANWIIFSFSYQRDGLTCRLRGTHSSGIRRTIA